MAARSLRIAWLGPAPGEDGGVPGVASELLQGLTDLGHRIDCFFPSSGQPIPQRLLGNERLSFNWGTSEWQWGRWYSRTRITAFASGMIARSVAMVRLRGRILESHRVEPYDLIYQFSSIESLAVPGRLTGSVPLVIHPETHSAGELRALLAEWRLGRRCQPIQRLATVAGIMLVRSLVQRRKIGKASLLVCISGVFRDHLVKDYRFPRRDTVVVPNPVRLERFRPLEKPAGEPPVVLVLGRIAVRKGIQDVVALAGLLASEGSELRLRIVGGPSLWSDYTPLLGELPAQSAEYIGGLAPSEIPAELAGCDVLLQASRYEPFALTVAEALAAGVPVLGTSEVGALEGVDRAVVAAVAPGDVPAMARALEDLVGRVRAQPAAIRVQARAEAERLFAAEVVARQISDSLERLVAAPHGS